MCNLERIKEVIQQSIDLKTELLNNDSFLINIKTISDIITNSFRAGNKVLFCGNGGSAADAQHLAAEFSGRFYFDRPPLPAEALHVNTSFLTAVANDYSYDEVYARMVKATGKKGDVLVAISTSGSSANIINAINTAKDIGLISIGFTGKTGGKMKEICDYLINVPCSDTPRIQEIHILIGHIICELTESALFNK